MLLRFARDYRGQISADRLIFVHGHDRSRHYAKEIWGSIDRLIRTDFFWTHDFGGVVGHSIITTSFRPRVPGPGIATGTSKRGRWVNMDGLVEFLFKGTSLSNATVNQPDWRTPCCATMWMSPKLLLTRTSEEYDLILKRMHWLGRNHSLEMWDDLIRYTRETRERLNHNYVMGEILERSWTMIFTGKGEPLLDPAITD
jgi:hypothetical protein